ncbi:MAG TPA: M56 family metallopeptidase, partial [Vicinamibacterales bacterium]|nr:M56 family metallopeptidase [Vicinamibacterales bacterium]
AVVHLLAQAAFWFHPMVWWIGARLVDERERACDEAVLDAGSERHSYAESILTTCRLFAESPLPCVSGVTGADLKKRIEHIMTSDVRSRLNMWKKGLLAAAGSAALAVPFVIGVVRVQPALAQAGGTGNAAFDVTSVKPNNSGSGMIRMLPAANGGWQAENVPLGMLVRLAYQLQDNQIVGGPKWLFEDRFDVMGSGTAPGHDGPMFDKVKQMLADRFKLVTHVETREQSMYALVLARSDGKLGEKMTKSTADCTPSGPNGRGRGAGAPSAPGERPKCGFMIGPGRLMVGGQTMAAFATNLSRFVGGIVVDKTGLTGTYDVELTYAPDPGISLTGRDLPPQPGAPPPPAAVGDAPSIFSAVQEQLGLKLDSTKGPVDVLVIDSAEKPRPD